MIDGQGLAGLSLARLSIAKSSPSSAVETEGAAYSQIKPESTDIS